MELKNFVSQTLVAIVEGVVEAQASTAKHGAFVNPGGLTRSGSAVSTDAIWDKSTNNYARAVSFDVAIAVEEGTSTQAKIGVVSGFFNAGAGGASENKERAMSRIQFVVPLLLPTTDVGEEAREKKIALSTLRGGA